MEELLAIPSCFLVVLFIWSSCSISLVHGISQPSAMFVFGDSYSDTGNHYKNESSWNPPYGITWPGEPAGRFSDGRILTDFLAGFFNLPSPVPFRQLIREGKNNLSSSSTGGVNFAIGGSGVFNTFGQEFLNLSAQVAEFQGLMNEVGLNQSLIGSSLVLLSYAGNDYIKYIGNHGSSLAILTFIPQVTREITVNVRSLYQLGFRTFVITNIQPAGCLPSFTKSNNFTACNSTGNTLSSIHNSDLVRNLESIQQLPGSQIVILDQFSSFKNVISNAAQYGISQIFEPCCLGSGNHTCGNVDGNGQPLFKVCKNPKAALFWDNSHPTQTGWRSLTEQYKTQLKVETGNTASSTNVPSTAVATLTRESFTRFLIIIALILWL